MIVDHTAFVFFTQITILRIFGRLAFPLFAFFISEGFLKTSNRQKYLLRLFLFAVVSQIPYIFMIRAGGGVGTQLNIFFTLSAGLLGLILIDKYKNIYTRVFIVLFLIYISIALRFEYGAYGMILMFSSYLFMLNHLKGLLVITVSSAVNAIYRFQALGTYLQIFALGAFPFMYLYNGQKGTSNYKNWFYYIYPVHMLALAILDYYVGYY